MTREERVRVAVVVEAPLQVVWEYNMDISKIPEFHPRVAKVDFISGTTKRAPGVSYQCNIVEGRGKGTCVEKITDVVPMERFTTTIPEDSWGLSKMFEDYVVETTFTPVGDNRTKMEITQYYSTPSLKGKLLNLVGRRKITGQTRDTLNGLKQSIEKEYQESLRLQS